MDLGKAIVYIRAQPLSVSQKLDQLVEMLKFKNEKEHPVIVAAHLAEMQQQLTKDMQQINHDFWKKLHSWWWAVMFTTLALGMITFIADYPSYMSMAPFVGALIIHNALWSIAQDLSDPEITNGIMMATIREILGTGVIVFIQTLSYGYSNLPLIVGIIFVMGAVTMAILFSLLLPLLINYLVTVVTPVKVEYEWQEYLTHVSNMIRSAMDKEQHFSFIEDVNKLLPKNTFLHH